MRDDDPVCVDEEAPETQPRPKALRGFALLSDEARRAVARKGGHAAHVAGTAHRWTKETAAEAGRKGGKAPHATRGKARAT